MIYIRAIHDARLIRRGRKGDPKALAELVEEHLPAVQAVAYAILGPDGGVEDAVQETFLKALQNLQQLREPLKLRAWLTGIARNASREIARKQRRYVSLDEASSAQQRLEPNVEQQEVRRVLREQVLSLDEKSREVLLLHYYAGKSTRDIAAMLDVSSEVVKKRLQRARTALSGRLLRSLGDVLGDKDDRRRLRDTVLTALPGVIKASSVAAAHATAWGVLAAYSVPLALLVGGVGVAWLSAEKMDQASTSSPVEPAAIAASVPTQPIASVEYVPKTSQKKASKPFSMVGDVLEYVLPSRQVMAEVYSVSPILLEKLGIPWEKGDEQGLSAETRSAEEYEELHQALKRDEDSELVIRFLKSVERRSNAPSTARATSDIPYLAPFADKDAPASRQEVTFMEVGTVLWLLPQLDSDGSVTVSIILEQSWVLYLDVPPPEFRRATAKADAVLNDDSFALFAGLEDPKGEHVMLVILRAIKKPAFEELSYR